MLGNLCDLILIVFITSNWVRIAQIEIGIWIQPSAGEKRETFQEKPFCVHWPSTELSEQTKKCNIISITYVAVVYQICLWLWWDGNLVCIMGCRTKFSIQWCNWKCVWMSGNVSMCEFELKHKSPLPLEILPRLYYYQRLAILSRTRYTNSLFWLVNWFHVLCCHRTDLDKGTVCQNALFRLLNSLRWLGSVQVKQKTRHSELFTFNSANTRYSSKLLEIEHDSEVVWYAGLRR